MPAIGSHSALGLVWCSAGCCRDTIVLASSTFRTHPRAQEAGAVGLRRAYARRHERGRQARETHSQMEQSLCQLPGVDELFNRQSNALRRRPCLAFVLRWKEDCG